MLREKVHLLCRRLAEGFRRSAPALRKSGARFRSWMSGKGGRCAAVVVAVLAVCLLSLYLCRNRLLAHFASERIERFEQERGVSIRYADLRLEGLREVVMEGLTVVPHGADTLLSSDYVSVRLGLWGLLSGEPDVDEVCCRDLRLTAVKSGNHANYSFFFHKGAASAAPSAPDYGKQVDRLLSLLFRVLPERAQVDGLLVSYERDGHLLGVRLPHFREQDGNFSEEVEVFTHGGRWNWVAQGHLLPSRRSLALNLSAAGGEAVRVPALERWNTEIAFRALSMRLDESRSGDYTSLVGRLDFDSLTVDNRALAPTPVWLRQLSVDCDAHIGKDYAELTDRSKYSFNGFALSPSILVRKPAGKDWKVRVSVEQPFFPAQQFFEALPDALFESLADIRCEGRLAWHFLLDVDFDCLDSLQLESSVQTDGFRIVDYGASDLLKLNGEFLYTAYENGVPVRTFLVGPSHPGFLPLDSIPEVLQQAVMQSEDGSFYGHDGFRIDALRKALAYDLRVSRFARGGSTISMQLVKNVFLNRNKNLFRKLEESVLTWLIESQNLCSKRRMYEVYLNICEWGPGIYGAREATAFYFSKEPAALTPSEAVFLAALVPRPKKYLWLLADDKRHASPKLTGYFHLIGRLLAARGVISEEEAEAVSPEQVVLSGPAVEGLEVPADSTAIRLDFSDFPEELPDMPDLPADAESEGSR